MYASLCATFIGQQLEGVFSLNDFSLPTVGNTKGRVIPLNHHIGWVARPSVPHPTILVKAKPCPDDHSKFGHPVTKAATLKLVNSFPVCADTGCQSTAMPPSCFYKAGYKWKDFIAVASKMNEM